MSFTLSVLTPAGKVYEDTVDSVAASGVEGGFEVYSNHQATLAALKEGPFKIRKNASEQIFQTGSGILEVTPEHNVLVLVDSAQAPASLS